MGQDKNERRKMATTKSLFNGTAGAGDGFDWGGVDCDRLRRIIALVAGRGGAIRFGYSRDGQAGSVGIYYSDNRDTLWCRPSEDVEDTFKRIESIFEGLPYTGGKAPE